MGQMNDIPNQVRKAEVLIELNLAKDIKGNTKGLYRFFCDNREDLWKCWPSPEGNGKPSYLGYGEH